MLCSIACFLFLPAKLFNTYRQSLLWVQIPRKTEEYQGGALGKNNWAEKKTRNPSNKRSDDHVKCSVSPWVWNPTCIRQAADCCPESSRELTTNSIFIKQHTFCNRSEVRCQFSDNIPDNIVSRIPLIVSTVIFALSGILVSIPVLPFHS